MSNEEQQRPSPWARQWARQYEAMAALSDSDRVRLVSLAAGAYAASVTALDDYDMREMAADFARSQPDARPDDGWMVAWLVGALADVFDRDL